MSKVVGVKGIPAMKRALARAGLAAQKSAEEVVAEEVQSVQDDARRLAPRKTGELRRRIVADAEGLEGTVKSKARHATFVEHGTFKDKAQPYMAPAAALSRKRLPKRAAEIIRTALERR